MKKYAIIASLCVGCLMACSSEKSKDKTTTVAEAPAKDSTSKPINTTPSIKERLHKKWTMDLPRMKTAMQAIMEKDGTKTPQQIKESLAIFERVFTSMGTISYEFLADGTVKIQTPNQTTVLPWEMNSDGKSFTMGDGKDYSKETIFIQELTEQQLGLVKPLPSTKGQDIFSALVRALELNPKKTKVDSVSIWFKG